MLHCTPSIRDTTIRYTMYNVYKIPGLIRGLSTRYLSNYQLQCLKIPPKYTVKGNVHCRISQIFIVYVPSGVVANLELGERSGVRGRIPQRGPWAEPWSGVRRRSPLKLKAFFWISQGRGHFSPHLKIS